MGLSVCLSGPPLPFEFCHVFSFSPFKVHVLGRISADAILTGIKVGGFLDEGMFTGIKVGGFLGEGILTGIKVGGLLSCDVFR